MGGSWAQGLLVRARRSRPVIAVAHALQLRDDRARRRAGEPGLSMHGKQDLVRALADRYGCRILVETGTHRGDMVLAMVGRFERIVTIELDPRLWRRARALFARDAHVRVLQGDSGKVLPQVLPSLGAPTLFWLDAHYSGPGTARGDEDSPALRELEAVLATSRDADVVLLDDADAFDGQNGYPTLQQIKALVQRCTPGREVLERDGVIRILPRPGTVKGAAS